RRAAPYRFGSSGRTSRSNRSRRAGSSGGATGLRATADPPSRLLAGLLAASPPRLGRRANPQYPVSNGTSNPPHVVRRTSMGRWEASGEQRRQTRTLAGVRPGGWSARGTPSGALVAVALGRGLRPDPDHVPVRHSPPPAHDRLLELPRTGRSGADRRDARDQPDHRLGAVRGLDGDGG